MPLRYAPLILSASLGIGNHQAQLIGSSNIVKFNEKFKLTDLVHL